MCEMDSGNNNDDFLLSLKLLRLVKVFCISIQLYYTVYYNTTSVRCLVNVGNVLIVDVV